jgi:hypothetical protein
VTQFLAPTAWIDLEHPEIAATAARLTRGVGSEREKAVRIHDFVRDEVRFGFTRSFYRMRASDVLEQRVGYCNTKATLFIALLRAAGIPARQHFVDISAEILAGFVRRPGAHVDHSYTAVLLDGRWVRTDSYIVDPPLFTRAQAELARSGRALGWGVHRNGRIEWDGRADAFAQFVDDGLVPDLSTRDYGVFADTRAFYEAGHGADRMSIVQGALIRLFIGYAGARVRAFREAPAAAMR